MTMEFAYYPGCASCATGLAYDMSTRYIARTIGLKLRVIPDWNCCGASAAHLVNRDLSLALPARSLALSEKRLPGLDVVASCAACFGRLKTTRHFARESNENRAHLESLIDREYRAEANVFSLLQIIAENDDIKEAIQARMTKVLSGLKIACYYGCMLVRPTEVVEFDDEENPQSMDDILRLVGAEPVDWAFKSYCCGASLQVTEPSAGKTMVEKILHNAQINGAEAIATACPLCQLNVDMRQKEVNWLTGSSYDLPVYYFTELIALCLGATPKEIGLDKHYNPAVTCASSKLKDPRVAAAEAAAEAEAAAAAAKPKPRPKPKTEDTTSAAAAEPQPEVVTTTEPVAATPVAAEPQPEVDVAAEPVAVTPVAAEPQPEVVTTTEPVAAEPQPANDDKVVAP
ncbi:MAG: heterodisulfide reductase-related iron-sulfur binding cluster [Coriobacteriia bacterium]|nr:heterodisulfide reductase-related iron-sulfur binding cluster [Coriobacteriia bacterium]